jgi:hypothetical protein
MNHMQKKVVHMSTRCKLLFKWGCNMREEASISRFIVVLTKKTQLCGLQSSQTYGLSGPGAKKLITTAKQAATKKAIKIGDTAMLRLNCFPEGGGFDPPTVVSLRVVCVLGMTINY